MSSKKAASPSPATKKAVAKAKAKVEDAMLDALIEEKKVEKPTTLFLVLGAVVAFAPVYLAHGVFDVTWYALTNLLLFIGVTAAVTYMLGQAYSVLFESELLKRKKFYSETKSETDETLLSDLRQQVALGNAAFTANLIFLITVSVMQGYLLRKVDGRVSYFLSASFAAALTWFIALKNEQSRKKRLHA
jgi:hypothetical protein